MRTHASHILFAALLACAGVVSVAQAHGRQFQFEKFPVKVYAGAFQMPTGVHKDEHGAWRDALEKWVAPPEVTFAGEYYLAVHSCGAFCRYYQLFNLRTGKESDDVARFAAADDPPHTRDGHPYMTFLYSRPDSRLLIAEYHLDYMPPAEKDTCRQQYFVLENGKLHAISKIYFFCTEEG